MMNTTTFYNQRIKYYTDENGEIRPYHRMTFTKNIFNPYHHELRSVGVSAQKFLEINAYNIDMEYFKYLVQIDKTIYTVNHFENQIYKDIYSKHAQDKANYIKNQENKEENINRAVRRAKQSIYDKILANEFDYFITLTLDKNEINRSDVKQVVKKMNIFLQNRVQRNGLRYIIVPEYHKDGNIHFHGLINNSLKLVDSGTVKVSTYNKPIKVETANRYKIPQENRITVYNIPEWKYGFTTAIPLNDNKIAVAKYITKYITKDTKKIAGRFYYHSSNLKNPIIEYKDVNYNEVEDKEIKTKHVDYKVWDL